LPHSLVQYFKTECMTLVNKKRTYLNRMCTRSVLQLLILKKTVLADIISEIKGHLSLLRKSACSLLCFLTHLSTLLRSPNTSKKVQLNIHFHLISMSMQLGVQHIAFSLHLSIYICTVYYFHNKYSF